MDTVAGGKLSFTERRVAEEDGSDFTPERENRVLGNLDRGTGKELGPTQGRGEGERRRRERQLIREREEGPLSRGGGGRTGFRKSL